MDGEGAGLRRAMGRVEVLPVGRLDFASFAVPADAGPAAGGSVIVGEEEPHALVERGLFAGAIADGRLSGRGGWGHTHAD